MSHVLVKKKSKKKEQFSFQKQPNLVSRCPTAQHQPGHYKLIYHLYDMRSFLIEASTSSILSRREH